MSPARRLVAGALLAAGLVQTLTGRPPGGIGRWTRTNHRGRPVSLLSGPALALAAVATSRCPLPAAAVAGLGAATVGGYDDVTGARAAQSGDKGLRGHAAALRQGRFSAGGVKVVGIGAAGLLAARLAAPDRGPGDLLLDGALTAAAANLLNLFDLRPGRALKVGLLAAAGVGEPGPAGAVLALLPADLGERAMLGDAGANGLGAVLGLAAVTRWPHRRSRLLLLAGTVALTGASEVVSFSRVIEATPPLRRLDQLGRLP